MRNDRHPIGNGIAADGLSNAYVTGRTNAPNFPTTPGAFQTVCNPSNDCLDTFVAKINATGSKLVYSTYLSGYGTSQGFGIAVDSAGRAYVTGSAGGGFPTTPDAFETSGRGKSVTYVSGTICYLCLRSLTITWRRVSPPFRHSPQVSPQKRARPATRRRACGRCECSSASCAHSYVPPCSAAAIKIRIRRLYPGFVQAHSGDRIPAGERRSRNYFPVDLRVLRVPRARHFRPGAERCRSFYRHRSFLKLSEVAGC
jgi:hypothetical protein